MRNVAGRAMLGDSTVHVKVGKWHISAYMPLEVGYKRVYIIYLLS